MSCVRFNKGIIEVRNLYQQCKQEADLYIREILSVAKAHEVKVLVNTIVPTYNFTTVYIAVFQQFKTLETPYPSN